MGWNRWKPKRTWKGRKKILGQVHRGNRRVGEATPTGKLMDRVRIPGRGGQTNTMYRWGRKQSGCWIWLCSLWRQQTVPLWKRAIGEDLPLWSGIVCYKGSSQLAGIKPTEVKRQCCHLHQLKVPGIGTKVPKNQKLRGAIGDGLDYKSQGGLFIWYQMDKRSLWQQKTGTGRRHCQGSCQRNPTYKDHWGDT